MTIKGLLGWTEEDRENFRVVRKSVNEEAPVENVSKLLNDLIRSVGWKIYFIRPIKVKQIITSNVVREPEKVKEILKTWGNEEHPIKTKKKIIFDRGKIREECLKFQMYNGSEDVINKIWGDEEHILSIDAEDNLICNGEKLCRTWGDEEHQRDDGNVILNQELSNKKVPKNFKNRRRKLMNKSNVICSKDEFF
jgi:hypothetical protein